MITAWHCFFTGMRRMFASFHSMITGSCCFIEHSGNSENTKVLGSDGQSILISVGSTGFLFSSLSLTFSFL